ncbi:MAG: DedA family protein [Candidatus Dormibacteria bacterium]
MNQTRESRLGRLAPWLLAGIVFASLVLAIVAVASDFGPLDPLEDWGRAGFGHFLGLHGRMWAFLLLYLEESGIPMPLPGDVFVMYTGHASPRDLLSWVLSGAGLVLCVVLGATNLFWLSRHYGPRLARGRVGAMLHLTPGRLTRAEGWFRRYGALALIFGRHIPGFRVPITVVAGTLQVPYRTFILSVAVSSAGWVAIFLPIGITQGPRVMRLLSTGNQPYLVVWAVIVALIIAYFVLRIARRPAHPQAGDPVEGTNRG